jgi:class 3 adenylate cyclase
MDLGSWLRSLGLERYEAAFRENEIGERVLPSLTAEDLKEIGVGPVGHRRMLLEAIAALRTDAGGTGPSAVAGTTSSNPSAHPEDRAERRQVTVMFSDLVGSTALSARMDPEDLREIITTYQKCVADTVQRFGGFVAKYMGDGVLVYFGYPQAHEDDAERAVRAGLELVAAVSDLKTHAPLKARIGIATGLVVVGDLIGSGASQEQAIVGETPNLAARLQGLAVPNSVIIGESTRRLVGNLFELDDLGAQDLKGIAGPVRAWAAVRPSSVESRFDALHASGLTDLVGREEELELLLRRWSKAKVGEGQVVLLSGEPGIGKSRLTAAVIERLANEPHTRLRYFCSPQHTDSALYPVISQMERAASFAHDDTAQAKLDKLDAVLAQTFTPRQEAALLAEMLSLTNDGRHPTLELAPQQRRQSTLEALTSQLEALSQSRPVLMIFEDVHWVDPTSFELLSRTVDRLRTLGVLLIVTFRPEFEPPWVGRPHVTALSLNRLGQREIAALIDRVTGNKALPEGTRQDIIERTDGIPLFIEEMTRAVLEAESEGDARRTAAAVPSSSPAVPASLHASLMARLDRLGLAKEVAQVGAAIGREFSHSLLAAVTAKPEAELLSALDRVMKAGLLFRQGSPPHASYIFKHALIQDAAYSTMLRARRQQLHSTIAQVLEAKFAEVGSSMPEVVAQQFERAGQNEQAIAYWQRAGERDLRRFAMKESIRHYSHALNLVTVMPETTQRSALELGICLGLGLAHQIGIGPTAKESGLYYERALALSGMLPNRGRERFLATWGRWFYQTMSRRSADAFKLSEELVVIARELDDRDLMVEAYHAQMPGLLWKGDFAATRNAALDVIRLYDRERHRDHAYYFGGHDSRVCARSFYAMSLWGLGYFDQAREAVRQCVDDARALGHTFSLAHSLNMGSLTLMLLNDVNACRVAGDELYPLAERNKFPWPLTYARFLRGWVAAEENQLDTGIEQMLIAVNEPSAAVLRPMMLTLVAEQQLRAARIGDCFHIIDQTIADIQSGDFQFYKEETIRLRGEALLAQSRENIGEAEAAYKEAIAGASRRSCRAVELRATMSLARLWRSQGKVQQARDLLAPVYGWFTEGFDTRDLKEAKALLEELAS